MARRCALACILAAGLWPAAAADALTIAVHGNRLVRPGHGTVRLIGVNRSGSEYSCTADDGAGGHGYGFFQGPVSDRAIAAMAGWKVNAVAIPLNEACWLGGYGGLKPAYTGSAYRNQIAGYVRRLNAHGMFVVLRLSGAGPGDHFYGEAPSDSEAPMADADHSITFWRSVARRFRANHAVLFHIYDEPHALGWRCLRDGCDVVSDRAHGGSPEFGTYRSAGQQAMVDAIRGQHAGQPIIVSGINFAGDVSRWEAFKPRDPRDALVVDLSSFDYGDILAGQSKAIAKVARTHPVVFGGFGDTDCNSDYSSRLMRFADRLGLSYLAWTWNTTDDYGGCSNALLQGIAAYFSGAPSGFGAGVRAHYRKVSPGPATPGR